MFKYVPKHSYATICILNEDLYHWEDWNFVFGYADYWGRAGVFSFIRYHPNFYDEEVKETEEIEKIKMFWSIKVMWHEIGHMFGMKHCTYYQCIMNGLMSAEE